MRSHRLEKEDLSFSPLIIPEFQCYLMIKYFSSRFKVIAELFSVLYILIFKSLLSKLCLLIS